MPHVLVLTRLREELQQLQLPQRPKTEQGMVERKDLLDSYLPSGWFVKRSRDSAIRPFTDGVKDLIVFT